MPNGKTESKMLLLAEKKQAEPNAVCRWCESPVEYWDQYAEDYAEGGMLVRECCPHCGESYHTKGEESAKVLFGFLVLVIIIGLIGSAISNKNNKPLPKEKDRFDLHGVITNEKGWSLNPNMIWESSETDGA